MKRKPTILFKNNKGVRLLIPAHFKLSDLAAMGVGEIKIVPKATPLPDGWWKNIDEPKKAK